MLRQRIPALTYSVSSTTRPPRPGEIHGVDYFFVEPETFREGIRNGTWAEWAEVHGNHYGTSADFLNRCIERGVDVLLDIDVQGAAQIVRRFPEAVTIFIMPPSMAALKERLVGRGEDDAETVERRMRNAEAEMARKNAYRHVLVNDRLEAAADALEELVKRYRERGAESP